MMTDIRSLNEQLNAIERLQSRCRAAIWAGDAEDAWALWDEATEAMKALLGMPTRSAARMLATLERGDR